MLISRNSPYNITIMLVLLKITYQHAQGKSVV